MKLILHIGMGKTGTSALQQALTKMRQPLLERGVLYPETRLKTTNHNYLALLTENPDHAPGIFRTKILNNPNYRRDYVSSSWEMLHSQIAKYRPRKLILSAENLFYALKHDINGLLISKILSLSDDITTIAYVRQPSKHYLSGVQQRIKNSATFSAPGPASIKEPIQAWEHSTGRPVQVFPYDRKLLRDQDSTSDFLYRTLDPEDYDGIEIPSSNVNESLSAEAMAILQDFRRAVFPGQDGLYFDSCTTLKRTLVEEDNHLAHVKPELHPQVADYIDYASSDLLWLKDVKGIVFSNIDYARISPPSKPLSEGQSLSINDICRVDAGRKDALAAITFDALYRRLAAERKNRHRSNFLQRLLSRLAGRKRPSLAVKRR